MLPLKGALDISLRKRSREPACASGKELFLSEISEALERCPVNSEEPLNSWSLLNVLGFCWIFEILRYFSEYLVETQFRGSKICVVITTPHILEVKLSISVNDLSQLAQGF